MPFDLTLHDMKKMASMHREDFVPYTIEHNLSLNGAGENTVVDIKLNTAITGSR